MSEWMPIESAPKNGTTVLVFWENKDGPQWCLAYWGIESGSFLGRFEGWHSRWGAYALTDISKKTHSPTHWQPLSVPPSPIKDE